MRTAANIGISPLEFGRLTLAELNILIEAHNKREEERDHVEWQKWAWQTAHLLNIHLKKSDRVKFEDLMPRRKRDVKPQTIEGMAEAAVAWVKAAGGIDKRKSAKGRV